MKLMIQIGIVFGVCLIGQILSSHLPIPVPGSIISMILLFIFLALKFIKIDHIRLKADFLLKNMAFFFVPAGVGIIEQFGAVRHRILPILAVIVITTFITFGVTALTVRGIMTLQNRLTGASKRSRHE